jgi:hypothetical protein
MLTWGDALQAGGASPRTSRARAPGGRHARDGSHQRADRAAGPGADGHVHGPVATGAPPADARARSARRISEPARRAQPRRRRPTGTPFRLRFISTACTKEGHSRRPPSWRSRLPLPARSSHDAGVAAIGVTGPCALAVARGRFSVAPIAGLGAVTGVGDRINTHVRRSRRNHGGRRSAGRRWCCGLRKERSRRPERSFTDGYRKRASVGQRRFVRKHSGAVEGVVDGRRPAPVQIDHSGGRGPLSSL